MKKIQTKKKAKSRCYYIVIRSLTIFIVNIYSVTLCKFNVFLFFWLSEKIINNLNHPQWKKYMYSTIGGNKEIYDP